MLPNPYLHVIGADSKRLEHAIRFDNANWTPVGDVESQAGDPGSIASVAAAADGAVLHLFVAAGSVYHAIRNADGTWTRFEDIGRKSGIMWNGVHRIAAAVVGSDIHICGALINGRVIHAVFANGAWSAPVDIGAQAPRGSSWVFLDVSCTNDNGELFVAAATLGFPFLLVTKRHGDGSWDLMTAVIEFVPIQTGQMLRLACASVLQDIHVVAAEVSGQLLHVVRDHQTKQWSDFVDVETVTGNPGTVLSVAATDCANELHVLLSTDAPNNWRHGIRRADGTWQPFGDVWLATNGAHAKQFASVACAGAEPPEGAPVRTTSPALAFQFAPCLAAQTEAAAIAALTSALKRIAKLGGAVGGLLGGAQVSLSCVEENERGGVFIYSESQQARDNSIPLVDLFSRTKQGASFDFAILFGTGAIAAALAAVWDTYRGLDGRVTLPGHSDVELFSYSVELLPPRQIRLNIDGQVAIPGGMLVGFTVHYTDTFSVKDITQPPDGSDSSPHHVVVLKTPQASTSRRSSTLSTHC